MSLTRQTAPLDRAAPVGPVAAPQRAPAGPASLGSNQSLQRLLLYRAAETEPAEPETPAPATTEEPQGLLPPRPGQSTQVSPRVVALFQNEEEKKTDTLVSRSRADASNASDNSGAASRPAWLDHPEQSARSEAPYATGFSGGEIAARLGAGHPLEPDVRSSLESRHGKPLDQVRVHTDAPAADLCGRFQARAFALGNRIAFSPGAYAPRTPDGERLLRHEVTHVVEPAAGAGVFRAVCPSTCAPGTAPAFVPVSDASFNCYAYAMNTPGSGFLQPGQIANTTEFRAAIRGEAAAVAAVGGTAGILSYFSPAGVLRNATADLGSPLARSCSNCCTAAQRKIVSVTTAAATSVTAAGPVTATGDWDHHWYRKDADGGWSHKRGGLDAQRDDSAGSTPICNPCSASRNHPPNYLNVVGSWCQ
jgi:hypothetical protein